MKNVLIILSLPLILSTCKKSGDSATITCTDSNTVMAPQVAKDYLAFKPGTWWVYEDLVNNSFDSLWVGENTSEKRYYNNSSMGTKFSFCAEVNITKIYNKDYNMNAGAKLNMPYVENVIEPLYNGSLGGNNYHSISTCPPNVKFPSDPSGQTSYSGGKYSEFINKGYLYYYVDSNYQYILNSRRVSIINKVIVNDTIVGQVVWVCNVGLFSCYSKVDKINIILRRYNIVQ